MTDIKSQPEATDRPAWRFSTRLRPNVRGKIVLLQLISCLLPALALLGVWLTYGDPTSSEATVILTVLGTTVGATLAGGLLVGRAIAGILSQMTEAVTRTADGAFAVALPALQRNDEIGALARALQKSQAAVSAFLQRDLAFDGIAANVMLTDAENRIVYLNKSIRSMLKAAEADLQQELPGFDADALAGANIDVFGGDILRQNKRSADLSAPCRTRIQIGGRTFDLVASAIAGHAGQNLGTVIEWADRTKELDGQSRLEIERAERERCYQRLAGEQAADKRQYESLVRNIPGAVYRSDWNADWTMQLMSDGIRSVTGHSPEAFLAGGTVTFGSLIHADDQTAVEAAVADAAERDAPFTIEYRVRHCDGSERWVFEKGCVVKSADRKPLYLDGVIIDITERKQIELAMQQLQEEMRSLLEAAAAGDFAKQIQVNGRTGLSRQLAENVNGLMHAVHQAVGETGSVMAALSQGDLSQRVTGDHQGDLACLRDDINATAEKLASVISRTIEVMSAIKVSTTELSIGAADLSSRTEEQAASLEEITASIRRLAGVANQSAESADQAKQLVLAARTAAESGGAVAGDAVTAMGQIEKSSRRISDIIGMIDEIAFQTNLLALNAAVEAARAGGAGRGFAVVAKEVRNLAQRSSTASKEIKALIVDSSGQVLQGVELVSKAGKTLIEIVTSIKRVSDIVTEIAAASREQSAAVTDVQTAIDQIEIATQHNAALVEESSAAVSSVDKQVQDILEVTAFFNTGKSAGDAKAQQAALARQTGGTPVANSVGAARTATLAKPRPARHAANNRDTDRDWKEF